MSLRWTDACWQRAVAAALLALALSACGGSKVVTQEEDGVMVEYPADAMESYQRALDLMDDGDDQRAVQAFEQLVAEYPEYSGPWMNLALIHVRNARPDDARAALEQALATCTDCAAAYNQLGILQRRAGQFTDAEQSYLAAIGADPDYALAYFNLGVLYDLYRGRPDLALQYYEAYQAHRPPTAADEKDIVDTWIIDLRRRVGDARQTAEVFE